MFRRCHGHGRRRRPAGAVRHVDVCVGSVPGVAGSAGRLQDLHVVGRDDGLGRVALHERVLVLDPEGVEELLVGREADVLEMLAST